MVYTVELNGPADEEFSGLPDEAEAALSAWRDAIVFDPWEYGRALGEVVDKDKAHRTLPFGDGRGLVTFLIYDPDRLVFVTKILWFG